MIKIETYLTNIFEKFDVKSYKFTQKNNIGTLSFILNEPWNAEQRGNKEFIELVKELEIISKFIRSIFTTGKKTENDGKYVFIFVLKSEYYDGTIDMSHYYGQMLNLVAEKNIKSKEDFYRICTGMLVHMSNFTHTLKFKEKRKYREIKLSFIENLYRLGFIESISRQISYCNDNLILFNTKFGTSFHLRMEDCNFVSNPKELELLPSLYLKREVGVDNIDMEFQNYISLLKHSGDEFNFINTGILN